MAPEGLAGMNLAWVLGVDTDARDHMTWCNKKALLAYSSGSHVVLDCLRTETQTVLSTPGLVSTIAISQDGLTIASGAAVSESNDPAVILWDVESGTVKLALYANHHKDSEESHGIQSAKFSTDGCYMAATSCYPGHAVYVWNTLTGDLVGYSAGTRQAHHCLAWHTHAMQEFVTGGEDELTFWFCDVNDATSGVECIRHETMQLPQLQAGTHITCLGFADKPEMETQLLYAGSSNGTVSVWDSLERTCLLCFHADASDSIEHIWCHSPTKSLVTGSSGGMLRRWQQSLEDTRAQLTGEMHVTGAITGLSFEPEMTEGVVATDAGAVWYVNWSAEEEALVLLKSAHVGPVLSVEASTHESLFGTCGSDGSFRMWSMEGAKDEIFKFEAEKGVECTCLTFSPADKIVAVGFGNGAVRIFDISGETLEPALEWNPSESAVEAISFVAQGEVLCVGTADGAVTLGWLGEGGMTILSSLVDMLQHRNSPVSCISASPLRPDTFLVCSEDQCLSVWECTPVTRQAKIIDFFETNDRYPADASGMSDDGDASLVPAMQAVFSTTEDNILIFAGQSTSKAVVFYDFLQQNYVRSINVEHYVQSLAVSPDGGFIAVGTPDHLVKLIDYQDGNFQDFEGHNSPVTHVAFEQNNGRLLSCGHGMTLLWDC